MQVRMGMYLVEREHPNSLYKVTNADLGDYGQGGGMFEISLILFSSDKIYVTTNGAWLDEDEIIEQFKEVNITDPIVKVLYGRG